MVLGLLVTAIVPLYVVANPSLIGAIANYMWPIIILQVAAVLVLSLLVFKLPVFIVRLLFFGYAFLTGFTIALLGVVFTFTSILYTLGICCLLFVGLSIYGYTTSEDLSQYNKLMMGGLIAIILISVLNIFIRAPFLYWIGSVLGVVVFCALTVYDVNRIKNIAIQISGGDSDMVAKMGIVGALSLYLDFINLFYYLLNFFGNRRD
jgi:hypothetical protein